MLNRLVELFPGAAEIACKRSEINSKAISPRGSNNNIDRLGSTGRFKARMFLDPDSSTYGVEAEFSIPDKASDEDITGIMADAIATALEKKLKDLGLR